VQNFREVFFRSANKRATSKLISDPPREDRHAACARKRRDGMNHELPLPILLDVYVRKSSRHGYHFVFVAF
jgi:hypothetical protein